MKRVLLGVLLVWRLSVVCQPTALEDWYIGGGTGVNNSRWGIRNIQPQQTSASIGYGKPEPGCVIAYRFLPENCTPENLTADGQSWEGM